MKPALLVDVNVLVYAHRAESPRHAEYRAWLERLLARDTPFGVAPGVLARFIRTVTHPAVFREPTPLDVAIRFAEEIRGAPTFVQVRPGPRHWPLFLELARAVGAQGNMVTAAYLAALAVEADCNWVTTDPAYARFPGVRVKHPLDSQ